MNILQFLIDIRSRDNGVTGTINRIQSRIDSADQAAGRLQRTVGGLRTAFMSLPGADFFMNPVVAITAGIGAVSKLGMEADKTATSFRVLVGDTEKADNILGKLNRYARDTIYDRSGVQDAAKTMIGFGVSAETVYDDLRMLGDVAGGNKQIMSQLALVYGQVAAAGKLQGQDLLQLINAGYNPLMDIAALTGKSMAEVRDEMSNGNISFELMRQAFMRATGEGGRFYQMTERLAETPFGRFQQLLGEVTETLLNIYNVIQPLLIPTFDTLSALLQMLNPLISAAGSVVSFLRDNIEWLSAVLLPLAGALALYNGYMFVTQTLLKGWTIAQYAQITAMMIAEKVQWLLNAAMTANPIGLIIAAIGALTAGIIYCWNKFAGFRAFLITVWDVFKNLGSVIKDYVVNRIMEFLEGIGTLGQAIKALLSGDFQAAWNYSRSAVPGLMGTNAKRNAVSGFVGSFKSYDDTFNKNLAEQRSKNSGKKENKISEPRAAGGTTVPLQNAPTLSQGSSKGKSLTNDITAGGTRSTSITVNIQKFFDNINVTMMDRADSGELQRIILESMNRAMEIALTTSR